MRTTRPEKHEGIYPHQFLWGVGVLLLLTAPWLTNESVAEKLVRNGITLVLTGLIVWLGRREWFRMML